MKLKNYDQHSQKLNKENMWILCLFFIIGLQSISGQTDPRCPALNDPNNVVHLPHETDCTLFYKCDWGTPVLFLCQPFGTHWSVALDRCDWPDVANCQLGGSSTINPTTISTISQEVTVPSTITNPISTLPTVSTSPTPTPDPRCPALNDPNNVVHLPHETDCTLFYKCDWGTPVLFLCQPFGTHWSVALDRCDWPDVANCQLGGSSTINPTTISTISQEVTVPSTITNPISTLPTVSTSPTPTPDPRCPALNDPNNVVHLPHETDCTLFYKCDWGTPVLFVCQPLGTHWSVALDRCEVPSIAGCELDGSTTVIPPTSTGNPTTNQEVTVDVTSTIVPSTTQPITSTISSTTQPITTTISSTTQPITSTIQSTTTTISTTQIITSTIPLTTTTQEVTTITVPTTTLDPRCPAVNVNGSVIHLPHEYDCTKFYTCDWGLPILMSCPESLHWSVETNRCDWPLVAKCDESLILDPICPFPQTDDALFPHETDCTKYYKCWWGLSEVYSCPTNTHFSVITKRCEDPFVAQCDPAFITTRRTMPTAPTVTSTTPMKRITISSMKY